MKSLLLILIIFSFFNLQGQTYSSDSLIKDFLSEKIFIVNDLAIANADSAFFYELSNLKISSYRQLNKEEGKKKYGTIGSYGAIELTVQNVDKLNNFDTYLLETSVLQHFIQEDSLFYLTNGVPNHDIYRALNTLIGMKIDTIQILGPNQAIALWGKNEGKNGAVVINCNRDEPLKFK